MLTLLKNAECYSPDPIGKNDILLCGSKIYKISPEIPIADEGLFETIIDLEGYYAFPGIIDQHVHITGGGGEEGYASRISEIDIQEILHAGVTTLAGLLGADNSTRSLAALYAKAKSLELQGISTFIYSGCYSVPPLTFTGNTVNDIVFIDKVIGFGEIAVSDYRSSNASTENLLKIASDVHLGGMLGGKAGVFHLHLGDGKNGLTPLLQMIEKSDLPMDMFVPTHLNRNSALFGQALEYYKSGGNIDFTAGETKGIPVPEAIQQLMEKETDLSRVTVSSDANGSTGDGGVSCIQALFDDIVSCIEHGIKPETAFRFVTENVANLLRVYPQKGALKEGSDADILVLDKEFRLKKLFGLGKMLIDNENQVVKP